MESELRRFRPGISLVLLFLAAVILAAEVLRHSDRRDLLVAGTLLLLISVAGAKLLGSFFVPNRADV